MRTCPIFQWDFWSAQRNCTQLVWMDDKAKFEEEEEEEEVLLVDAHYGATAERSVHACQGWEGWMGEQCR